MGEKNSYLPENPSVHPEKRVYSAKIETMTKILLLEDRASFRKLYALNLNVYLGSEVMPLQSLSQSLSGLESMRPDLIISRAQVNEQDVGFSLAEFIRNRNQNIPMIVLGESLASGENVSRLGESFDLRPLLQTSASILNKTAQEMAAKKVDSFYGLPSFCLNLGFKTPCHLYARESGKFRRVLEKGFLVGPQLLGHLARNKLATFYIRSEDRLAFVNSKSDYLLNEVRSTGRPLESRLEILGKGHELMANQAQKMGISPETVELATASIENIKSIAAQSPVLRDFFTEILKQDLSFRFQHSLLTAFVGSHLLKVLKRDDQVSLDRWMFVSFFHDIMLEEDEFAKFQSDEEIEASDLSVKDKNLVKNHALMASKLVTKIPSAPFGADDMIKHHHGSANGRGLSALSPRVHYDASLFMLAEEWVQFLLQGNGEINRSEVMSYLKEKYRFPNFKAALKAISTLK